MENLELLLEDGESMRVWSWHEREGTTPNYRARVSIKKLNKDELSIAVDVGDKSHDDVRLIVTGNDVVIRDCRNAIGAVNPLSVEDAVDRLVGLFENMMDRDPNEVARIKKLATEGMAEAVRDLKENEKDEARRNV